MNVQFKSELISVKPVTQVNSLIMSTLERDEDDIRKCQTKDDLDAIQKQLLLKLGELEKRKAQGYDIYQDYEDLKYKFEVAKEVKQIIAKEHEEKIKRKLLTKDKRILENESFKPTEKFQENKLNELIHNRQITQKEKTKDEKASNGLTNFLKRKNESFLTPYSMKMVDEKFNNFHKPNHASNNVHLFNKYNQLAALDNFKSEYSEYQNSASNIQKKFHYRQKIQWGNEIRNSQITKIPDDIIKDIFQHLAAQKSYQILLVFYKCKTINSDDFSQYFQEILTKFYEFDLSMAFCNFEDSYIRISDFAKKGPIKTTLLALNINEFLVKIANLKWDQQNQNLKLVCYISDCESKLYEINQLINQRKCDFLKTNTVAHSFLQMESRNCFFPGGTTESFSEFLTHGHFRTALDKAKMQRIFSELLLLKRLSIRTIEDLNNFKMQRLNNEAVFLMPNKYTVKMKTAEKKNYYDFVEPSDLISIDTVIQTNDAVVKFKNNYQLQEAFTNNSSIYWIEKCGSEANFETILDINATTKILVLEFNKQSSTQLRVSRNYSFSLKNETFLANKTDLRISQAELKEYDATKDIVEAFMHFTYQFTNKRLIAYDLRAIKIHEKEILLTEPIVFSVDNVRYGASNLGEYGINYFMSNHQCNSNCRSFISGITSFLNQITDLIN